jgi:hypothetical protein
MKTSGLAVAAALCAALAAGPGFAQEDATKAGSDQGAPRADGGSIGDGGATKDGADAKGVPAGVGQNPPREDEPARPGLSPRARSGIDSSRKGTAGAMGVTGTPSGSQSATLDNGVSLTRPSEGLAALLRRASRGALIAATPHADPHMGPPVNSGAPPSSAHPGGRAHPDGGAMRNAIGVVVPGTDRGAGGVVPGSAAHPGIGAGAQGGAVGINAGAGNLGGGVRPAMPLNVATGPAAHAAGINGTTMGHIAASPGSIGGPVKDRSAINGTTIRPKH